MKDVDDTCGVVIEFKPDEKTGFPTYSVVGFNDEIDAHGLTLKLCKKYRIKY